MLTSWALAGCGADSDVTLYVALDQEHSESIVRRFESESGLRVKARFDTEASKTVGLVSALLEESARPRCDVFWNNELAHTVRLAQKRVLQPYKSPNAVGIPDAYKDPEGMWAGFAARARILIVNTKRIPDPADYPQSVLDLANPKWRGQCGVALPLTGTTLTHFTALRLAMGTSKFDEFLESLRKNDVVFLQSNGATMKETASGRLAFALTDTDDFHVALDKGNPVAAVFPDQGEGQMGTMLIPNSVAMIRDCPHPEAAKRLIDFVLSKEVEGLLAAARSAQIPLRAWVPGPPSPQIRKVGEFRQMRWDAIATASALNDAATFFGKWCSG